VWDGSDLLVFGGFTKHTVNHTGLFNTVGDNLAFNPASGEWRPIASQSDPGSATSAPNPKQRVQAVWTGTKVVLFAGAGESAGGGTVHTYEFDPATDLWDRYPYDPMPGGSRIDPSVAWDGREIIVWGGVRDPSATPADPRHDGYSGPDASTRSDGWLYSPKTHKWTAMADAPVGAVGAATVWTGQQFLVWGGDTVTAGAVAPQKKGYAYDPDSNTWSELPAAPFAGLAGVTGVWTGDDFVVWGRTVSGAEARGAAYDPVRGTWSRLAAGSEVAGPGSAAFWTGSSMLVVQGKRLAGWQPAS
jgi:N-acetylneuraminic acid mutarotase